MRAVALPQRLVTQAEILPGEILRVRIQKELKNHNSGNRHPHWAVRDREMREWRGDILSALVGGLGNCDLMRVVGPGGIPGSRGGLQCRCEKTPSAKRKVCVCPQSLKRKLTIIRWVPSAKHYTTDRINTLWLAKQLQDAIVGLGLLRDDADKWCTLNVLQEVSADGLFWTEIQIAPIERTE